MALVAARRGRGTARRGGWRTIAAVACVMTMALSAGSASAYIPSSGERYAPQGLAYDPVTDTIYSGDADGSTTCRVLAITPTANIRDVAGNGSCGDSGDGGPATAAEIEAPQSLAVDATGDIYAGLQYTVRRISRATGHITDYVGDLRYPCLLPGEIPQAEVGSIASHVGVYTAGMATDPVSGHLFVSNVCQDTILEIDELGVIVGKYGGGGSGNEATGALAFDAEGNLYFRSSAYGYFVRKMDRRHLFSAVAGNGSEGIAGNGGPATLASLDEVVGLAVDSRGVLFISTSGPLRSYIRSVNPRGTIEAVAGKEWDGRVPPANGSPAERAEFWSVGQLVFDGADDLYMSDFLDLSLISIIGPVEARSPVYIVAERVLAGFDEDRSGGGNPSENTCDQGCVGDPVNTATGEYSETTHDLALPGRGPALDFARTYGSLSAYREGPLGYGWTGSYFMSVSEPGEGIVKVRQENGSTLAFEPNGRGGYLGSSAYLATLVANRGGGWTLTRRERERFVFDAEGRLVREVDLNGETTTLSYEGGGALATITDPAGRILRLSYDGEGHVREVADSAGRTVRYGYTSGNLTSVVDARGQTWTYAYDTEHRLLRRTDPNRHLDVANEYEGERVVRQRDAREGQTTFSYVPGMTQITSPARRVRQDYYTNGELVRRVDGVGTRQAAAWEYVYESVTHGTTKVTDPNGHVWRATYDAAGHRTSTTDPLEHTTSTTYDELGDRLTAEDALHVTTTWTYDERGNLLSASTPLTGTETSQVTRYVHGEARHPGDVTAIEDPRGKTTQLGYDAYGDVTSITDPLGDQTTKTYDEAGNLRTVVSPRGNERGGRPEAHTTTYVHDAAGALTQLTDPLGRVSRWSYDPAGNLESTTDTKRQVTSYAYDAGDLLTTITRPDRTTLRKGYDADGNLTSATDGASHATTYAYDELSRLSTVTDPARRTTTLHYDGAGNTTSIEDPLARTTRYAFDEANRTRSITYSDRVTPNVTFGYDADGQRTSMRDGSGTTTYVWDSLHRLYEDTDGNGKVVRYGYDLANDLTSLVYSNGSTVERTYDDAGRLATVTDWLGGTTRFAYDADSELLRTTFPAASEDVDASVYDEAGELRSSTFSQGARTLASLTYTRDEAGLPTQLEQTGLPGSATARSTYSSLNQLATQDGHAYAYDTADNATNLADARPLAYDAANELTEGPVAPGTSLRPATFAYDLDGNRTTATPEGGTATRYSYDQGDRLTRYAPPTGSSGSYVYDGDGLRIKKTVGATTTRFVWDRSDGLPLVLSDATNSYVYGPGDVPLEQIDGSRVVTYYHHDELGSTRLLTSARGAATATFTYAPYGTVTGRTGTAATPLAFAGQYTDAESGLQYLRARYYDPATGQFMTRDPLSATTGQPYGYAGGNPLSATDPSGLFLDIPGTPSWSDIVNAGDGALRAGLDVAAFGAYGLYYGSYRVARVLGPNPVGVPLWALQAAGLGTDAGIDWVKARILKGNSESVCDEGREGYINPFHGWLPGPLKGPKIYLPGIHPGGKIDIVWR